MSNVSNWLPQLLGPHALTQDGGDAVPARSTWDVVGATLTDDPDNDRTIITITAGDSDFDSSELRIANPAGTFWYTFAGSAILADRTLTLPLLGANDVVVCEAFAQTLTNKTISGASNTLTVRLASDVTGTLPVANGGTGITSLGTGVATWLGTPSGANLASALTTALPDTKGGTGLTSLGTGVATFLGTPSSANLASACSDETGTGSLVFGTAPLFKTTINLNNPGNTFKYVITPAAIAADRTLTLPLLAGNDTAVCEAFTQTLTNKTIAGASNTLTVRIANDVTGLGTGVATFLGTPSGANLASALTTALPDTKGGTGLTALGTGVATFLGTPSSANLASAVTDETGSGALVFGTSPTISGPTISGSPVFSATDMSATGNARAKAYSNIVNVQTTDATVTSIFTWTILDEAVSLVTYEGGADLSSGADTAAYVRRIKFKRDGGTVTAGTVETTFTDESDATWDCTIDNSTSTGRVRVTGKAASTIDHGGIVSRLEVSHA